MGSTDSTLGEKSTHELKSLASRIKAFPHAMTAEELAGFLSVSRLTILRRAKRGTIPCFHVGSCVRFDPANISKWLMSMGVQRMSKP
jgi:excisionase family DNA binding protein